MIFSTSWDDGYKEDLRVAKLLETYNMQGTFYVCPQNQHGKIMLQEDEIRSLSERHVIGAHTLTHPKLDTCSDEVAMNEIAGSKKWIENITKKPCTAFCYPKGRYTQRTKEIVQASGFLSARTVQQFLFETNDAFETPTTLQIFPFPWRQKWKNPLSFLNPAPRLLQSWNALQNIGIPLTDRWSWLSLAQALFIYGLREKKSSFHLWGHSVELDTYNMWGELEKFLQFVSKIQQATSIELEQKFSSKHVHALS